MDCSSNKLEEVKKMVNELTKTVNDVTKSLKIWRNSEPHKYFIYQKMGHISHNCPNKQQVKSETSKGTKSERMIKQTNVRFFEFVNNQECQSVRKVITEKELAVENCLKIEIDLDNEIFDVRALSKRHYAEDYMFLKCKRRNADRLSRRPEEVKYEEITDEQFIEGMLMH
ncbi:23234_t:CDS:2, partial [Dentiscutata erythropus]